MLRCTVFLFDSRFAIQLLGVLTACLMLTTTACENEVKTYSSNPAEASFRDISSGELKALMDRGEIFNLIDIRTAQEYMAGHLANAVSMPYRQLTNRYRLLDNRTMIVIYCRTGQAGALAVRILSGLGFSDVHNLFGGFSGWEYAIELSNGRQVI